VYTPQSRGTAIDVRATASGKLLFGIEDVSGTVGYFTENALAKLIAQTPSRNAHRPRADPNRARNRLSCDYGTSRRSHGELSEFGLEQ
jgi:hypothetical protein